MICFSMSASFVYTVLRINGQIRHDTCHFLTVADH